MPTRLWSTRAYAESPMKRATSRRSPASCRIHPQTDLGELRKRGYGTGHGPKGERVGLRPRHAVWLTCPPAGSGCHLRRSSWSTPNTGTSPLFHSRRDAEITIDIYKHIPVLWRDDPAQNPWESL